MGPIAAIRAVHFGAGAGEDDDGAGGEEAGEEEGDEEVVVVEGREKRERMDGVT